MNDYVKEYIETGKDLNTICNDRIKRNDKRWCLLILFVFTIWIGFDCVTHPKSKHSSYQCDSIHKVDSLTIKMQLDKMSQAVYFKDIK